MKASFRPRILLLCMTLMLLLALTAALAACGGRSNGQETTDASLSDTEPVSDPGTQPNESTPADTQPEDDTSGGGTETQPVETQPETADPTVLIETSGYPAEQAGASSGVVLSVADFGAKGDGVPDDAPHKQYRVRTSQVRTTIPCLLRMNDIKNRFPPFLLPFDFPVRFLLRSGSYFGPLFSWLLC